MSRGRAVLVALAVAALDALALPVFWEVRRLREGVIAESAASHSTLFHDSFYLFEGEARILQAGGAALALLGLLAVIAGLVWSYRRRASALVAVAIASPAAVLGVAGLGVTSAARAFLAYGDPCADAGFTERYRYETFASYAGYHDAARLAILVLALLSTGAILALAGRAPPSSSSPRIVGPALIFLLGLTAFAVTRAEARDGRRPMPLRTAEARLPPAIGEAARLPPARGCAEDVEDAPSLAFDGHAWLLDGVTVPDAGELARTLREKRKLWAQVLPGRPFPSVIAVTIPADASLDTVRPMLAAARAEGFVHVDAMEVLPVQRWASATLGDVTYTPRGCRARLMDGIDQGGAGTWGELVATVTR